MHGVCVCVCVTHNNDEGDQLCVCPLPTLSCDDVPFLWCAHDHLSGSDLLLVQLVVPRQLAHGDVVWLQTLQGQYRSKTINML